MKTNINLQNTHISFTPSFLGNGWETSLLPQFEREVYPEYRYTLSFGWLKKMLLKMQESRKRKEVLSWATATIASFFL